METTKIIALIAEDIKHNKLINGLESIGLTDNDRYTLSLDLVIADMMGYQEGKVPDRFLETYHKIMLAIPHSLTEEETNERARNLFDALSAL